MALLRLISATEEQKADSGQRGRSGEAIHKRASALAAEFEQDTGAPKWKITRAAELSAIAEAARSAAMAGAVTLAALVAIEAAATDARRAAGVF